MLVSLLNAGISDAFESNAPSELMTGLCWLLVGVLVISGSSKVVRPQPASEAAMNFGIVRSARHVYGRILGVVELAIAFGLAARFPNAVVAGASATVLFAAFTALLARALGQGATFSCGCMPATNGPITSMTLLRTCLLTAAALIVTVAPPTYPTTPTGIAAATFITLSIASMWILVELVRGLRSSWFDLEHEIDWGLAAEIAGVGPGGRAR
jgi:hypothetical protein